MVTSVSASRLHEYGDATLAMTSLSSDPASRRGERVALAMTLTLATYIVPVVIGDSASSSCGLGGVFGDHYGLWATNFKQAYRRRESASRSRRPPAIRQALSDFAVRARHTMTIHRSLIGLAGVAMRPPGHASCWRDDAHLIIGGVRVLPKRGGIMKAFFVTKIGQLISAASKQARVYAWRLLPCELVADRRR